MEFPGRFPQKLLLTLVLFGMTVASQAGILLVANKTDNTVNLVDPATGESRATLPTGHRPHEAAASPDGKIAVISNYGDRGNAGSSLTVIDLVEAKVLRTVDLGQHTRPHGLAWLPGGRVAVTTEGSAHLLVVDPYQGKVLQAVGTGQQVSHMVVATRDGKRAFVANIGSGTVTVIDLEKGAKIKDVETGAGAEGIALTPDGKQVWVSNRAADTLTVIGAATLDKLADLPCAGFPIRVAITPDGKRALVSCARSGEVAVFDTATRREVLRRKLDLSAVEDAATRLFGDTFGESPVPVGLVIAPDGARAWVACTQADAVVAVRPATLEVVGLVRAGKEPDGMAFAAMGSVSLGE